MSKPLLCTMVYSFTDFTPLSIIGTTACYCSMCGDRLDPPPTSVERQAAAEWHDMCHSRGRGRGGNVGFRGGVSASSSSTPPLPPPPEVAGFPLPPTGGINGQPADGDDQMVDEDSLLAEDNPSHR
jgi:hypothetical protein